MGMLQKKKRLSRKDTKTAQGVRGYSFVEKAMSTERTDGEMEGQQVRITGENGNGETDEEREFDSSAEAQEPLLAETASITARDEEWMNGARDEARMNGANENRETDEEEATEAVRKQAEAEATQAELMRRLTARLAAMRPEQFTPTEAEAATPSELVRRTESLVEAMDSLVCTMRRTESRLEAMNFEHAEIRRESSDNNFSEWADDDSEDLDEQVKRLTEAEVSGLDRSFASQKHNLATPQPVAAAAAAAAAVQQGNISEEQEDSMSSDKDYGPGRTTDDDSEDLDEQVKRPAEAEVSGVDKSLASQKHNLATPQPVAAEAVNMERTDGETERQQVRITGGHENRETDEEEATEAVRQQAEADRVFRALVPEATRAELVRRIESLTPLCIACGEGHIEIVRILVEAGADKEGRTGGNTPLCIACCCCCCCCSSSSSAAGRWKGQDLRGAGRKHV
jgi:hypothetical protein